MDGQLLSTILSHAQGCCTLTTEALTSTQLLLLVAGGAAVGQGQEKGDGRSFKSATDIPSVTIHFCMVAWTGSRQQQQFYAIQALQRLPVKRAC